MDFLVRLKIAQCRKLFRAHLTLKRTFACVRPENIFRLLFIDIICILAATHLICISKLCFCAKRRVHVLYGQIYGFSPVCVLQ